MALIRFRKNLAHPIRCDVEVSLVLADAGHALALPTGDVWNKDIVVEMKLGFEQDDPPARSTTTSTECRFDVSEQSAVD